MLSAQKEDTRLIPDARSDSALLGSFAKVVNSIQGLQERLDSFSANDVGDTHDKVQTLLLRLSKLQQTLTAFAEIKVSIAVARGVVEDALRECADTNTLDEPQTRAFIQTLTQANKLIQFPRLSKSTRSPDIRLVLNCDELEYQEGAANTNDVSISAVSKKHRDVDPTETPELINTDAENLRLTIQPDIAIGTFAAEENDTEDQMASQTTDLPSALPLSPLLSTDLNPVATDRLQADICDSATSEICRASFQPVPSADLPTATEPVETRKDPVALTASPEFDQRLLDDLIKNYGEFLVAETSPRTNKPTDTFIMEAPEDVRPVASVTSNDSEIERQTLPTTKRNGDLDRQLKQLIKDYGEYDLYSRQSPLSLKTGVIVAFLLLALIFSGFYYFSPKTLLSQNSNVPTSGQSSANATDDGSLADGPGANAPATDAPHTRENTTRPKNRP